VKKYNTAIGKIMKSITKEKKDSQQIQQEFYTRQTRQIVAIAITLFLVALAAVLYKRPDVLGEFSKRTLYTLQIVSIALFWGFTIMNWRCPSCQKSLGHDIQRRFCKKCGVRLR
jgi:ABC-type phosphate/phosphonate transport system permease subunit